MIFYLQARKHMGSQAVWVWPADLALLVVAGVIIVALAMTAQGSSEANRADLEETASGQWVAGLIGPSLQNIAAYQQPPAISLPPRTRTAVRLYVGPDDGKAVLGTLGSGARVEILGRNETGDWLAVRFPPKSSFSAWLPAQDVINLTEADIAALDVQPVRPLP